MLFLTPLLILHGMVVIFGMGVVADVLLGMGVLNLGVNVLILGLTVLIPTLRATVLTPGTSILILGVGVLILGILFLFGHHRRWVWLEIPWNSFLC